MTGRAMHLGVTTLYLRGKLLDPAEYRMPMGDRLSLVLRAVHHRTRQSSALVFSHEWTRESVR